MRLFFCLFVISVSLFSQEKTVIKASVVQQRSTTPIQGALVGLEGLSFSTISDVEGHFELEIIVSPGQYILTVGMADFKQERIPIELRKGVINLGNIVLERDVAVEQTNNLVTLTDAQLSDENGAVINGSGLLQATRDVFLSRAAFEFSQAFFRVRGYDSRNGQVLINGLGMNRFFDGRPQWNNWGGLNDVIRNQEFTNGLSNTAYAFGGILGNTNIDMRPSKQRPGTRLSISASNRTYFGRVMGTYSSGLKENGFSYAVSGSRRWAQEGFVDGTLYDAFSFFGAVEYQFNPDHGIVLTAIAAKNRRGRSTAITEEVFELTDNRYNPHWGNQNGQLRNSRERDIFEPLLIFNHDLKWGALQWHTGVAYQFGSQARSRLGFFNAPNPDPTYYRYLPSFYINGRIGADFTNAALAREGFLNNPQLSWESLFRANRSATNLGRAAYLLYDDTTDSNRVVANSNLNWQLGKSFRIDGGLGFQSMNSDNYAEIQDLLGADFHSDIDPFSNTLNDINGDLNLGEGAIFNYNYGITASSLNGHVQASTGYKRWNAFVSATLSQTNYQRDGRFQNERFLDNSLGKSDRVSFSNYGFKGGLGYQFSGRHKLEAHGIYQNRAPTLQQIFVNPRESNTIVPNIQSELVTGIDLNYHFRLPELTGRISAFYTRFQQGTDINFFFVDSGLGSDFVQEVITDLDRLYMGIEMGINYQISSSVKLSAAANLGKYVFANNPSVTINFDTSGQEEPIDQAGSVDLGLANLKDLKLPQGPQTAASIGIEYRDPNYWWVGATANYLADNYPSLSTITRTQSFLLNPETGIPFEDATPENVAALLAQQKLDDFYLLNLVAGKSWLFDKKYLSIFLGVNNVFDAVFRTGGFEQNRNGNFRQLQQDNLRNNPTFAPRFWYGFGRTYFMNLALSF